MLAFEFYRKRSDARDASLLLIVRSKMSLLGLSLVLVPAVCSVQLWCRCGAHPLLYPHLSVTLLVNVLVHFAVIETHLESLLASQCTKQPVSQSGGYIGTPIHQLFLQFLA